MNKIHKLVFISGFICLALLIFGAINPSVVLATVSCSGGNCWYSACSSNSDCGTNQFTGSQMCQGNTVYQNYMTFTCNSPGTADSYCTRLITPRYQQTCSQDQTCHSGTCIGSINTQNSSTSNYNYTRQYKKCVGNSVFWFDNYNYQQGLDQTCGSNQTCSNGVCVALSCASHAIKGCINNFVFWYDSCGSQQDMYQNCSATGQTCQYGACINNQVAYATTNYVVKETVKNKDLAISIFASKDENSNDWSKSLDVANNDKVNFLVVVKNNSNVPIDNVSVKTDITDNISYQDNLKIDNVVSGGNMVSGINLGQIAAGTSKAILFTGVVQSQDAKKDVKITGTAQSSTMSDSDSFTINISKSSVATAALEGSSLANFVKKWYFWLAIAVVLIFLLVMIFRRLSSNA